MSFDLDITPVEKWFPRAQNLDDAGEGVNHPQHTCTVVNFDSLPILTRNLLHMTREQVLQKNVRVARIIT